MEAPPAQSSSFLLIGAGCFGASTALYLKRSNPSAHVILLDRTPFPCPTAAAHDLNQIIRAEYEDLSYMRLALEAQKLWRSDPLLKPYYHETGILFAGVAESGIKIIENYKSITGSSPAELIDPEVAQARFGGIFRDADWEEVQKSTWNPRAGWGEAENALRSVIQAAVDLGVQYIAATVYQTSFDAFGACVGAQTTDGQVLTAERTVLCTGAHTAQLIADSAPDRPELQVSGRLVAAAAVMGAFRVPENQMDKFQDAPIVVKPMGDHPGSFPFELPDLVL